MKPKRTLSGYALLVGVLSLSVVGGALIYGIYSSLVKTQITPQQQALIKPLDGEIDTKVLDELQQRRQFTQAELSAHITTAPTPTATAEATPTPSLEITPTVTVASQEGVVNQL